MARIRGFDLEQGRRLSGSYIVEQRVGRGWEGEVYRVRERVTGIPRAAKLFFPHRNKRNITLRRYAKKLERLRRCEIVIQYHHSETIDLDGHSVALLVSELVDGPLLSDYIASLPGKRMAPFEALHLLYALARGIEEMHLVREYHGDLHDRNIFVSRQGIHFQPQVFDFFHYGKTTREHLQNDVVDSHSAALRRGGRRAHVPQAARLHQTDLPRVA